MDFVNPYNIIEIPFLEFIRNFGISIVLAFIWSWVVSNSRYLVIDTNHYLPFFLILIPTMVLIITVIKTSIALSLGLVGALSIVRFRTPIKEPIELVFIFVGIAVGLGVGANQLMPTLIGFSVIVIVMLPSVLFLKPKQEHPNSFINISFSNNQEKKFDSVELTEFLDSLAFRYRLKRISENTSQNYVTILVPSLSLDDYEKLKIFIHEKYDDVEIAIIDNAKVIT